MPGKTLRDEVAFEIVRTSPHYSHFHMPGDEPRKVMGPGGVMRDTIELLPVPAERIYKMADAVIAVMRPPFDDELHDTPLKELRRDVNDLRTAVTNGEILAAQEAWDRCEPWVDRIFIANDPLIRSTNQHKVDRTPKGESG